MRLTAVVPATVANLGPAFDCLGLALDLCNEVTIDTEGEPGVTWEGEGADELPGDGSDMVSRAIAYVAEVADETAPRLAIHGTNRIPLERGLGSSAAACVAGIALESALLGREMDRDWMLLIAGMIEGHPDNAAAAIHGGLTLAYETADGPRAERLEPSPELRPVVLLPTHLRIPTSAARMTLPSFAPFADAAFNAGRSALAVLALTSRPELLRDALQDRLHQRERLAIRPEAREVFGLVRDAGVPVVVAGAGPSLLAFETADHPVPDPGDGWRALRIAPRATGVQLTEAI